MLVVDQFDESGCDDGRFGLGCAARLVLLPLEVVGIERIVPVPERPVPSEADRIDGREGAHDRIHDHDTLLLVSAQDDVCVGSAALRTCARADIRHALERLIALARVVDEDERTVERGRVFVDEVVDSRHRSVVVLVRSLGHGAVEGVDDDELEPHRPEGLDVV